MSDSPPDIFRDVLLRFRKADAQLSSALEEGAKAASERRAELARKVKAAERIAADYIRRIENGDTSAAESAQSGLSPQIDANFAEFHRLLTAIQERRREHDSLKKEIQKLEREHEEALADERRAREQDAQRLAKRRRNIRRFRFLGATAIVCGLIALHFSLLNKTSLSFAITTDGKPAPSETSVALDGKPFASGAKITLGRHKLIVTVKNADPVVRTFWAFYGQNRLGTINVSLLKGNVYLNSRPADAEYSLIGNGQHWTGALPVHLEAIPIGTYHLAVTRYGWEITNDVTVARGGTTNITDFPYGSVTVSSEPPGLDLRMNGMECGKTPVAFPEIRPGDYAFIVSNDDGTMEATVNVAPNESSGRKFIFHYGMLQLESDPAGANISYEGKDMGKTPATLQRIVAGKQTFQLQLAGYAKTNIVIQIPDASVASFQVKLTSLAYLGAMQKTRDAFDAGQFEDANKSLAVALRIAPNDPSALEMQSSISNAIAEAEAARQEAAQSAAKARDEAEQSQLKTKALLSKQQFDAIIMSTPDFGVFPDHTREYQSPYDRVWDTVSFLLSHDHEKIGKTDKPSGVMVTELTRHGIIGFPSFHRYCVLVEKENDDSTKVTVELSLFHAEYVGPSGMTEIRTPDDLNYDNKKAEGFLDDIAKRLRKGG